MNVKIKICVDDVGGTYTVADLDEANKIAQELADEIYIRLGGKCSTKIDSIEEI